MHDVMDEVTKERHVATVASLYLAGMAGVAMAAGYGVALYTWPLPVTAATVCEIVLAISTGRILAVGKGRSAKRP